MKPARAGWLHVRLHSMAISTPTIIAKPLRVGVTSFLVAAIGAIVGFGAQYFAFQALARFAFVLVAIAVMCGFGAIVWGWYQLFGRRKSVP